MRGKLILYYFELYSLTSIVSLALLTENCLVLSPIRQIMLSNLPGFNRSFLLVENRSFAAESPFGKPAKRSENSKQNFPLFSFLAMMTLGCAHVFCPHGRMESP